jgi:pyrroloquinoline quinone biosynthesis protein B
MLIKVLGSAAAGGFPKWNCVCPNCAGLRLGEMRATPRTQTQIAFSPIAGIWFLIGASPDLRSQILAASELLPTPDAANPIAGVFLPSSELENVEGLLQMSDVRNAFLFATPAVQRILKTENRIFKSLDGPNSSVQWQPLSARRRIGCHLSENPGDEPTFFYSTVPLGGSYPNYLSEETRRSCPADEAQIGFLLEQSDKRILVAPVVSGGSSEWLKIAESADVALLDGARWQDLLREFPRHAETRKVLLHLHHENPLLDEKSSEHRAAVEAGFEIAYDGMEIKL